MENLPPKESSKYKILLFIAQYKYVWNGKTPPLSTIAAAAGLKSKSTVSVHLRTLEKMGILKVYPGGDVLLVGASWHPPEWIQILPDEMADDYGEN